MLLTIHNLPAATRYSDIKSLLQSKCGLKHVILDNLISECGGKKVTVGVAEDADAAFLVRKINGLYWNGMQLYVEDVRQQKTASEQPFRSTNPQPQEHADPFFHSMSLQQDISYTKGVPKAENMMMPAVHPMMAAMYYVPDYTNNMQAENYGGLVQTDKGYIQHSETVQSGYMGIGIQSATKNSHFGMTQYSENHRELPQTEKRSVWGEDYNEKRDFAAEKPFFGQCSPAETCEGNWFNNQQNNSQESPSRGIREPSWTVGGSDNRGPTQSDFRSSVRPTQPDFRSSVRPTQPDFRSTIRPEEYSGLIKPTPNFRPNDRSGLLEKPAPREFKFSGRLNEIGGFSEGQNNRQRKLNESERFPGRLNEFSGRSNDFQEPNEFSERQNNRQGRTDEFSGRPRGFSGRPNKFSGRPNQFSGRQNEFSGRQNEFSRRQNEFSGRQNEISVKKNEFSGGQNEFSARQNEFSSRPNVFSGNPNNRQGRPNEFSERQERPNGQGRLNNRPGPSRPHERSEFGYSEDRPDFEWLNKHPTFSKRGGGLAKRGGRSDRGHQRSGIPQSRKRKFEENQFENRKVERPERISRPDTWRQHPAPYSKQFREQHATKKFAPRPAVTSKAKPTTEDVMRPIAVRYVINDMYENLQIKSPNFITRQTFKKFITKRMNSLKLDKTVVTPQKCFEAYRAKFPRTDYKATYNTILGLIARRFADKANSNTVPGEPSKPKQDKPIALKPAASKLTKEEKEERKAEKSNKRATRLISQGKIPSFPLRENMKEEKDGYIPELEPQYKAAIEDEISLISDIFRQEFETDPNETLQKACNKVLPVGLIEEMKKLLSRGITRRITESGVKVVRIYGRPKLPKRAVIEKFLRGFGPRSLRKSQRSKTYTISVDTYKNLDKLCTMPSAKVEGDITLSFKPFHLAPTLKHCHLLSKLIRKNIIEDMIDTSDLNLLDKDWPAKEAEIKAKQAEIKAKENEIKTKEEKEAANAEPQNEDEKIPIDSKKQNEEAISSDNGVLEEDKDLSDKKDESNTEIESNHYLNEEFHVIDEVNETDSDIEFIVQKNEVVDIDEDNAVGNDVDENNEPENDEKIEDNQDDAADLEIDDEGLDIDDVDVDMDDIDDDDLEDY